MRQSIAAAILLCSALLLFTRLGHYALWDDEAVTALAGKGVWKTGDTSVVLPPNVVAYRGGLLLNGTKERSTPPLGAYLAAPFVGIFDGSTFAARFPFALLGLGSVGLMVWWLYSAKATELTWGVFGLAIIGNVSFWLYDRQCRYYSPAIFSTILIAYLYCNYNGKIWQLVLMAIAGLMLLASNYLNFLALYICLLLDYVLAGHFRRRLLLKEWLIILVPQVVIGAVIVLIWNTLGTGNKEYVMGNSFLQRVQLFWMNLRDINACEYGIGLFLLISPMLFFKTRSDWFWRGPLALVVYVLVVSMLSPQTLSTSNVNADVRYLAPLIPLFLTIGALVVLETRKLHWGFAIGLAVIAFETNLLNGAWINDTKPPRTPLRSTLVWYMEELADPLSEPYSPTIDWLKANVAKGQSIWVLPDYMAYPLMYHVPDFVYAWQFRDHLPDAFKNLPPIHLQPMDLEHATLLPDYIVAFGPILGELTKVRFAQGVTYQTVKILPVYWHDEYRPELFWHGVERVKMNNDRVNEGRGIYIFKLMQAPAAAPGGKP